MLILGIESSCDETGVALVRDGRMVLGSQLATQTQNHAPFGGVVPEIAAREHLTNIDFLTQRLLASTDIRLSEISAIAVTQGPGLIGALLVGISYAKGLAKALNKVVLPVNHVHAHVHGALLGTDEHNIQDLFPMIALVVSGGHTNMYFMENPGAFKLLAYTLDDACGECFDKVAKLFGLPYPGGLYIERHAQTGDPDRFEMPDIINNHSRLEFSYSGLKTHLANLRRTLPENLDQQTLANVCASFQRAALLQIVKKLQVALKLYRQTKTVVISGGVAANHQFRATIQKAINVRSVFPNLEYCSDNGAMIAASAYYKYSPRNLDDLPSWDAFSRYPFESEING